MSLTHLPRRAGSAALLLALGACQTPGASGPSPGEEAPVTPPRVLVGAGDIASCESDRDEATAEMLEGIEGTVFTLGDNAYPDGTAEDFARYYAPSWGRHKQRTRPAPGNHEYHSARAGPYFDYFGEAAGEPGKGWCWRGTTTSTSASPRRRPRASRTPSGASGSSWWGREA